MNRVQIVPSAHWAVMQNPVELVRKQQETIRSVCCGEGIEARADHQYQAWVLPQMAARAGRLTDRELEGPPCWEHSTSTSHLIEPRFGVSC